MGALGSSLIFVLATITFAGPAEASVGSTTTTAVGAAESREGRRVERLKKEARELRQKALRLGRSAPSSPLLQKVQRRLKLVEKRLQPRAPKPLPN